MLCLVLGWFLLVYHQENVYNGIYPPSFNTFADFNKQTEEEKISRKVQINTGCPTDSQ